MSWGAVGSAAVGVAAGALGGGGGGGSTSTTVATPTAQQTDLYEQAQAFQAEGAPDVSGSTGLLTQASDAQQAYAAGLPGAVAPAQQASEFALTDAINPASNPALQEYIQLANNQLTQQYQQQVAPALRSSNVQAGNVGSSRAGIAEGIARQGLSDAQGRQTAALTSSGYGQGLNAMMQALGLAPQTAGLGGLQAGALTGAADITGAAETNQYNADAGALQLYSDLVSGGQGGSTTTSSGPEASTFQNALAGGTAGLGLYDAYNQSNTPAPQPAGASPNIFAGQVTSQPSVFNQPTF